VVVDSEEAPTYGHIAGLTFSPDGQRVAYTARRDGAWHVVLDGEEGPAYEGCGGLVFFSADGQRTAYAAMRRSKWVLVVDGQEGREYDGIQCFSPEPSFFSPDGRHVAYCAWRGPIGRSEHFVVLDEEEGPVHNFVVSASLVLSPDSQRLAYVVVPEERRWLVLRRKRQAVVVDGAEGPRFDEIGPLTVVFGSDSRHLAYSAREGETFLVCLDQRPGPVYPRVVPGTGPRFGPDGAVHYIAAKEGWLVRVTQRPRDGV